MKRSGFSIIICFCMLSFLLSGFNSLAVVLPSSPTATPDAIAPTPATTINPGATQTSATDDMTLVYVPAGDFTMGFDRGSKKDMSPAHTATLDAFWIDQTEVTNGQYAKCVSAGACEEPEKKTSHSRVKYYNGDQYTDFPVINVSWNDADDYCRWAGRSLPTEAQWEKAARSTDGRTYPWGDEAPSKELVNYGNPIGDTVMAGSYPDGASLYGSLDMAGNVREWTADWYDETYHKVGLKENPRGPVSGYKRVARGGSWGDDMSDIRTFIRRGLIPITQTNDLGFRCAMPG